MMLLPLPLLAALALPIDVSVTTTEGEVVPGELKITTFKLETDFGSAVVDADKVARIDFGEPDVVVTTGNVELRGELALSRLRLGTEDGTRTFKRSELASIVAMKDGVPMGMPDFSGAWVGSFGPIELEQEGLTVTGKYGHDGRGRIEGNVEGRTLVYEYSGSGSGEGTFELWDSGDVFTGEYKASGNGNTGFWGAYRHAPTRAEPEPGEVVTGQTEAGLYYHVRVPDSWDGEKRFPAIMMLHGSNYVSKPYLETIATNWGSIGDEYVIVGLDGEKLSSGSTPEELRFNYTYVNFSGHEVGEKGRYRQSPALVAEALQELGEAYGIEKWFVGGHSQGGFLTWAVAMFYPQHVAGVFPMSCNLIVQCEPDWFDDEEQRAKQREVAFAVVHGAQDPTVSVSGGDYGYERFQDGGFPALHFFRDESAGHMFIHLPVGDAIRWLESMTSTDPEALVGFAKDCAEDGENRDALAALRRARELDPGGSHAKAIDAVASSIESKAAPDAKALLAAIEENSGGHWVDGFWEFRREYHFSEAAEPVIAAYQKLRDEHAKPAQDLFNSARNEQDSGERRRKRQKLIDEYYASKWYKLVKRWLDE